MKMSKLPIHDWNFSEESEVEFSEWFNDLYGNFSSRSEYFFEDCKVKDEKTLKDLMYKWIHVAFVTGFQRGKRK